MKRIVNVISLVVMLSSNIMAPFTYAEFDEDAVFSQESSFESSQSGGDFFDQSESLFPSDNETNELDYSYDISETQEDLSESSEGQEDIQNDTDISSGTIERGSEEFYEGEEENSQDSPVNSEGQDILESENNQSEGETGDNEQAKTDSDISVLDYLFHEGAEQSASSPFPGNEEGNLEQSFTGDVEELTGDALLLAQVWETLNVEPITKSDRYNKVTVSVEAPSGTFPEGTYASINPIVSTTKLDEIKDQISAEDDTVSQESEIVAFDISFWYKLGEDKEVEVQPKDNTVKVTFNYEDNDELSKADGTESQEVKVFHIEEVKDEDGNKTGEKEVNDVTNKEESAEDGIAVADAENFSIYAIITGTSGTTYTVTYNLNGGYWTENPSDSAPKDVSYTCDSNGNCESSYLDAIKTPGKIAICGTNGNEQCMFVGWYTNQSGTTRWDGTVTADMTVYAKWQPFGTLDFAGVIEINGVGQELVTFTMMDRNLGASSISDNGYYFQWGNNYGFTFSDLNKKSGLIDTSNYTWEHPYYSKYYITKSDDHSDWCTSGNFDYNNDLWGGAEDKYDTTSNNYYDDGGSRSKRQGPCPEGYHVPSLKEWYGVVDLLLIKNGITEETINKKYKYPSQVGQNPTGSVDNVKYNLGDSYNNIKNALNLVFLGNIKADGSAINRPNQRSPFWTSSSAISDSKNAYVVEFGNDGKVSVGGFAMGKNIGYGVRCFKDSPDKLLVYFNKGSGLWFTPREDFESYTKGNNGNAIVTLPDVSPVVPGLVFDKWYTDPNFENEFVDGTPISENIILYANYKTPVQSYIVTYMSDGVQVFSEGVLEGSPAIGPSTSPSKPDDEIHRYEFIGWSNDGDHIDEDHIVDITQNLITQPTTYYAVFDVIPLNKYVVTFDSNGGSDVESPVYVDVEESGDTTINLPTAPTNDGYDFAGWKADGDSSVASSPYTLNGDTDFVAQWTLHDYSIIYDYVGGTESSQDNPISYNVENNTKSIYSPTKTNYKFVGWKEYVCNEDNVNQCQNWTFVRDVLVYSNPTSIEIGGVGHKKYVAQWTENEVTYTVIWITEDLTDPVKVSQETVGTAVSTIKPADPSNYQDAQYSYSFVGWMKGNSQDVITNWENEVVEGFVIYKAKFNRTVNQYSVTFYDEDGTTVLQAATQYDYGTVGTSITVPTTPDKSGYRFDGWLKKIGDNPYSVDVVDMSNEVVTENVTYKAKYSEIINEYTITFVTNGGTSIPQIVGPEGTSITAPADPTKDGYTFAGWDTEIPTTMPNHDVTITAQWNLISYNISYDLAGGTAPSQTNPDTYDVENNTKTIYSPNKSATTQYVYAFAGWKEYVCNEANVNDCNVDDRNYVRDIYVEGASKQIEIGGIGHKKYVAQWTENLRSYTVLWITEDLTNPIKVSQETVGTPVSAIKPADPSDYQDAQYSYSFAGWTKGNSEDVITNWENEVVEGFVIYKAKFTATLRQYAITFVDENGTTVLKEATNYNYGTTPADIVQPATPTKADSADGHYRYKFVGWSPALVEVTADATYTATYDEIPNTFTVTWKNGNTTLETDVDVEWGTAPAYNGDAPEKDLDDGYQYTFSTWNDGTNSYTMTELQNYEVKSNVIFTAEFTPSPLQYSVNLDANGGEVSPSFVKVTYGSDYGHSDPALPTPTKAGWNFIGWYTDATAGTKIEANTQVTLSARNQTLYAHWSPVQYTVSYLDTTGNTPLTVTGATTSYNIETTITFSNPYKYGYTFIGWKEYVGDNPNSTRAYLASETPITIPAGNTGNRIYRAQWNQNGYVVVWKNADDVLLDMDTEVTVDDSLASLAPADPTIAADNYNTYTFDGWIINEGDTPVLTEDLPDATGDVTYTAHYDPTPIDYTISFVDWNGTPIPVGGDNSKTYHYGETVVQPATNPTRAADNYNTYVFNSWSPAVINVAGNQTYIATYTATPIQYQISFVDWNGTPIKVDSSDPNNYREYTYNTNAALIARPADPTKPATDSHTYDFAGWSPAIADVTADATYTAVYTAVAKDYTVTLNPDGGVIEGAATTKTVTYGQPYGTLPTPTKVGYTFGGWYDSTDTQQQHEITSATVVNTNANGQTLKAKWTVQSFNIRYLEDDRQTTVTVPTPVMTTYTVNDSIVINNPTKEGHTFIGWKECVGNDCSAAYLKDGSSSITIPAGKTGNRDYLAIWNVHGHVVVWEDYNGVVLEIDPNVDFGDDPSYDVEDEDHNIKYPSREDTDEWDYEFAGWTDGVHTYGINDTIPTMGDADITYTAVYSSTKKQYTITFTDEENDTTVSSGYDYGTTAAYLLSDLAPQLSLAADTECKTYVGNWTPEVEDVTGTATYTADYTCTEKQKYTVRFLNYDGFVLLSYEEYYGEMPVVYDEETLGTPQKDLNDGKVYKFTGWNPTRTIVTGDIDYIAQFSDDPNTFIVEFNPKGGTVVPYRQSVTFGSGYGVLPIPVKAGYEFDAWYSDDETFAHEVTSGDVYTLTGNQTLYAKWNINNYDITYQGVENSYVGPHTYTVEDDDVTIPNPTKDGYTFVAWKEYVCNLAECTSSSDWTFVKDILKTEGGYTIPEGTIGHREFRAQWNVNQYEVIFQNYDRSILKVQILDYGTPVSAPADPTKPTDAEHIYSFNGWQINGEGDIISTADLPDVSGNVQYVAHFTETPNQHTVTFKNYDGTILQSSDVVYGTHPSYPGTPVKPATAEHSYTFAGWTDGETTYALNEELPAVTGEATYTAVFTESLVKYTVTFKDWDDTIIKVDGQDSKEYDYGTTAANISKPGDPSREGYTFVGWDTIPATMPAQNIVVRATYTINSYTISFVDPSGENQTVEVTREYNADTSDVTFPSNWEREGYTLSWGDQSIPAIMPATNTTITAQWNIIQYTITFDTAGGSAIPPITQDYGTAITAPNNPTKDGYTFDGWNKEIPITMPAESITITAQWTADEHTITYNNTKGAINSNPVKFTTDTPTFDLSNLSVDGYTFDGWFDAETQGTKVEQISQGTITNLVLYAHWTPVTYAIAYQNVPNGYTAPGTYTVESTVIIPKPVRNGHTLKGWKEYVCNETNIVQCEGNDRHFVKDIFAEGDSTTINQWSTVGHREFRAQWNVNQYEVIFQNYDRSILKVQILDYGTPVTAPDDPSKPADAQKVYTFDGWQINGEGTVIATENLPTVSGDVHYVAHFDEDANHHTITFKNGDTVLQSTEVTYEQTPIYAGQTPTKANTAEISYTFAGWTDGTNEYAKDDTLPAVTGPATYTAIFTESPRQYTVIFVDYDGTELKAATAYDFGTPAANIVRPSDPTRVGYTFNGWDNIPETIPAHDVIVTATYTINQYTVTFDTDGGGSVDPVRVDYNTAISRPTDPTKDGYTFSKWQKVDGQTLSDYDFATPVTDNITLKAIWTKNNYTIVYKDGDQTITIPGATTSYTITDEIVIPNPEKLGYTFIGWKEYVDGEYTKAYLNEGSSITIESGNIGNRVYVAQWNNTTNGYVVLWIDWNDVIIDMNTDVLYGTPVANISKPSDPTRVADAQYTYTFANWTKDEIDIADITSERITGNVKYKAKYNETINKYKLIFVDEDGTTVLKGEKEYVYGTPVEDIEKPEVRIKTGWKFIGWDPALSMVTENVTYKAVYTINQYTIAFDTNGGSTIVPITQDYNTPINISNPTKEGYTFKGWIPSLPSNMPAENMVVVAQWEKSGGSGGSGGGSSSGGGGGKSSKKSSTGDIQENTDKNVEENTHNSAGDEGTGEIGGEDQGNKNIIIDSESLDAYEWARENSITTMNSIERADPDGYVTRGHLAKMLVNFVVNVLGRSIPYDVSYDCVMWNDNPLVWESDEIRDYAIKSCALGIMGINTLNNEFRPNDIVTRAEFGTVASRILWGDTYNELDTDNNLFYTKHLKALQESGFMMDIDNPLGRREIRKRVWLVLKRIELDQNKEKKES